MDDMISIIVPAFNSEKYLSRCLDSLLSQTYTNIEIIVVDDGSTDHTPDICDHYGSIDSRIRVFHQPNGGPSHARNKGLWEMRGRYLAFADADDYLEPKMLETLYCEMKKYKSEMVICRWLHHFEDTNKDKEINIGEKRIYDSKEVMDIIVVDDEKCGGGYLWNRLIDYDSIIQKAGKKIVFHDKITCYEDKIWILELLPFVNDIFLIDFIGYHYIEHAGSLHNDYSDKRCVNLVSACEIMAVVYRYDENAKARRRRDEEIFSAIWVLCKHGNKKDFPVLYTKYKSLFSLRRYLSNPKMFVKAVLINQYGRSMTAN